LPATFTSSGGSGSGPIALNSAGRTRPPAADDPPPGWPPDGRPGPVLRPEARLPGAREARRRHPDRLRPRRPAPAAAALPPLPPGPPLRAPGHAPARPPTPPGHGPSRPGPRGRRLRGPPDRPPGRRQPRRRRPAQPAGRPPRPEAARRTGRPFPPAPRRCGSPRGGRPSAARRGTAAPATGSRATGGATWRSAPIAAGSSARWSAAAPRGTPSCSWGTPSGGSAAGGRGGSRPASPPPAGRRPSGRSGRPSGRRGPASKVEPRAASGAPPETASTAYLERPNGTDRGRNARQARETYRLSRGWTAREAVAAFIRYRDNFGWPVRTPRAKDAGGRWQPRTPAMAAGRTDRVRTLAEWLARPAVQR
jgi:hypothetical protein